MNRFDPRKVFYQAEKLVELKKTGDTWPVHIQMGLTLRVIIVASFAAAATQWRIRVMM